MNEKPNFNTYEDMPEIPYMILSYLMENNENLFKLLKYSDKNALFKENVPLSEKRNMVYLDEGKEDDFHLFLKPLVGDELTEEVCQLRLYKVMIQPNDAIFSVLFYQFDTICGNKMSLVYNEKGIPCSRIDLIEKELLKTLHGADLVGYGYMQFSRELSRNCSERMAISNSKTFFGSNLILGVGYTSLKEGIYCE